jgi:glyoxalase family protein
LTARSREVPEEHALQGFHAVHARVANPVESRRLLTEVMGFQDRGDGEFEARGASRGGSIVLEPGSGRSLGGAGTVHHIAWASTIDEHEAWRSKVLEAGAHATTVIDRFYFKSVYFREPSGILYELATIGPGFTADEPLEHLGERLSLPPNFEHLRDQVEKILTPLPDTRQWRPAPVS